jgi:hypothetical protein
MTTSTLQCPMCDGEIPNGHRSHRGLLINTMASLSANLITSREMLAVLKKKRWSKQQQEQRDRDLAHMLNLEARIIKDQALLEELRRVNVTCYGEGAPWAT